MYAEAEAARFLGVPQSTLHYWLAGGTRRGKSYRPIIRETARDIRTVTWAEFVEAGMLREYRRTHQVPMAELRKFVELLRKASRCLTHLPIAARTCRVASLYTTCRLLLASTPNSASWPSPTANCC